jgi:antitoxin component YwqK of YwqJK toxin-antitoxin module
MKKMLIILSLCLPALVSAQAINKFHYGVDGNLQNTLTGADANNYSFTQYHSNGIKASVGQFKNGLKHGTWKTWDENGKLTAVAHYKNDEKTGKWIINETDHTTFEISFDHNHMLHALKKDDHGHIVAKR